MNIRRQRRTAFVAQTRRRRLIFATASAVVLLALAWWRTCDRVAEIAPVAVDSEAKNDRRFVGETRADATTVEELLALIISADETHEAAARAAELLEKLSAEDLPMALEVASAEDSRRRRLKWVNAILEQWAAESPNQALNWARDQFPRDPDARDTALEAVVRGGAKSGDIEEAERLLSRVNNEFPEGAETRRWHFVVALGEAGGHAGAVDYATNAQSEERGDLLQVAFEGWAQSRPEEAVMAAQAIADLSTRTQAWQAVVSRMAADDPEKLTKVAMRMHDSPERRTALAHALPQWILKAPAEASAWLEQQPSSAELDPGAAAIGGFAPLVRQRPDVAIGWAESIINAQLRAQTIASVMEIWMRADPVGAQAYIASRTP